MIQRYNDGAELPYRIRYNKAGTVTRNQELRFSREDLAKEEIRKLIARGHSVDYSEWNPGTDFYVTRDSYN